MKSKFLFFITVLVTLVSCRQANKNRTTLGVEYAKQELHKALTDTTQKQVLVDTLIKDKETAITIAEVILFKTYGKDNITAQQPYEINFIDGYWILNGTLIENMFGGTFLIIIKATNGQVIKLTHGK
jgi:hypothetical protein